MKYLSSILLLAFLFISCKKKNNNDNNSGNGTKDFSYSVKFDSIVTTTPQSAAIFVFSIKVLSGDIAANKLYCSITGLPTNMSVSPSSLAVTQLLGGVFTFNIGTAFYGDYPCLLKISGQNQADKIYNFKLRIVPPTDYAPLLAGTYDSCYDFCSMSGFTYYSSVVSTVADTPYLLKLTNIQNLGTDAIVRAWISNLVTVPLQSVSGKTIWGKGTYSQDARPGHSEDFILTIDDTLVSGTDTQTCTMHIEQ